MTESTTDRLANRLKHITADLKRYMEKRVELLLLNVGQQASQWLAESIQKITGIILLGGALIFLLVALALYLGEVLNSASLGYVLVSLPLLALGLMFYYLKPKSLLTNLQQHFEDELIKALQEHTVEEEKALPPSEISEE